MSAQDETLWWITLGAGLVVIVVVVALLSLLIRYVKVIDRRSAGIRDTLHGTADNTRHTDLIPVTATRVDAVLAEGLQHHLFLGRVLGKVKS